MCPCPAGFRPRPHLSAVGREAWATAAGPTGCGSDRVAWETPATGQLGPQAHNRHFPPRILDHHGEARRDPTQGRPSSPQPPPSSPGPGIRAPAPHGRQPRHSRAQPSAWASGGLRGRVPTPRGSRPCRPGPHAPHGTPPAAAPQRSREPGGNSQKLCLIVRFKQKRGKDCTQKLPEQTSAFKSPDVCQTQKTEILGPAPTSDTAWRDAPAAVGTCAWPLQPALACPLGSSPGQQG